MPNEPLLKLPPMSSGTIGARGGDADSLLSEAMQRVALGDRVAFAEVFQRTSAKLFGVCLRIMPTRQDAEDVLQEAYLNIWRRASSYDAARGDVLPWLVVVTRNCAVDRLRTGKPFNSEPINIVESVADPAPLASDMLLDDEQRQRLLDCVEELATQDVRLIRAAFLEGSTYSELATRAALPLGTVKSRIRRALIKLRDCL